MPTKHCDNQKASATVNLVKGQLKVLHVILACDEDHKKVFSDVPIIGFKTNKILKSNLVRAALPNLSEVGRCEPCG